MLTEYAVLRFDSALGTVEIRGTDAGVSVIRFTEERATRAPADVPTPLMLCMRQMQEYFARERTTFQDLPLVMRSSDFQQAVWERLLEVPYGQTITYGSLAEAVGHPGAARAVGNAMNDNPLLILVPCHRVLPSSGGIGQYAAGAERKEWLLDLEQRLRP